MPNLISQLVVRLVDQVSRPARTMSASLRGLNGTIAKTAAIRSMSFGDVSGRLVASLGGIYAVKEAIVSTVTAATDFESAMADIRKVADFPTPDGLAEFGKQLRVMSKSIPMSSVSLAALAASAAQAGIATSDLSRFTQEAAKAAVAFDISAENAGDSMAKIANAAGLTVDQVFQLNDAINALSNSQASSAADLIDFEKRVAGVGKLAGFSAEQVAAFGSAMVASGAEPEVAATSFRNLARALTIGVGATKAQRGAYRALGLDATKVARSMQKDAVKTTNAVLERIGKLPKDRQGAIISALFGDEARAVPGLIANGKLLAQALDEVSTESKYAGSVQKEFQARIATTAARWQLLKNRAQDLGIAIGDRLLPVLNRLMDAAAPWLDWMTQQVGPAADAIEKLAGQISALATSLGEAVNSFERFVGLDVGSISSTLGTIIGATAGLAAAGAGIRIMARSLSFLARSVLALTGISGIWRVSKLLRDLARGTAPALTAVTEASTSLSSAAAKAGAPALAETAAKSTGWLSRIPGARLAGRLLGPIGIGLNAYDATRGAMATFGALGETVGGKHWTPQDTAERDDMKARADALRAEIAKIKADSKVPEMASILTGPKESELADLEARLKSFDERAATPTPINVDTSAAEADVDRLTAKFERLRDLASSAGIAMSSAMSRRLDGLYADVPVSQ